MRSTFTALAMTLAFLLTAPVARAIDDCSTAFSLSPDSSLSAFDLSTFGDSLAPIRTCTGLPGENDIWGTITAPSDGYLHIAAIDANVSLYTGACGAPTELACLVPTESDAVLLTSGQTYLIQIASPPAAVTYTAYFCGDGVPNTQACDDGNVVDTDGCTNNCAFNVCGDGSLYAGVEECDDGNHIDGDACTDACTDAECGDGALWIGVEDCDDGNLIGGDGCEADCTIGTFCGDGVTNGGEECDDGNGSNTDACTIACLDAACGDGYVRAGVEPCDDGNGIGGDGCESDCTTPTDDNCGFATALALPSFQSVDLSAATTNPSDPVRSCSGATGPNNRWFTVVPAVDGTLFLTSLGPTTIYTGTCGALLEATCSPTSAIVSLAVTAGVTYTIEVAGAGPPVPLGLSLCGDGTTSFPEQCDDGNTVDTDACSNQCVHAACGDGTTQDGEQCDDGNLVNGDSCEDDCFVTSVCGDGDVEGHETCDDGNLMDGDGCDADCRLPCPDNLCKCLGAARGFAVVGAKLGVKNGKFSEGGVTEIIPTEIEGNVCGLTGTFGAKPGGETALEGDLVLTRPDGYAGVFKSYKENGVTVPGTLVLGDLATGGGLVKGPLALQVDGAIDTTGTHLLAAECTQAAIDLVDAATTLFALTPTVVLPEIALDSNEEQTINVGPGRQVLSIPAIALKGYDADGQAASLIFELQPTTDVLIINVPKVSLGNGAELVVSDGGGPASWIVNLGPDGKATIKKDAFLDAPLLSPNQSVSVPDGALTDAVFTTEGVKLQGGGVASTLDCEE